MNITASSPFIKVHELKQESLHKSARVLQQVAPLQKYTWILHQVVPLQKYPARKNTKNGGEKVHR